MVDIFVTKNETDSGTLAAVTAVLADINFINLGRAFLLKSYRVMGHALVANLSDKAVFGLAYGDATIAQIAAAMSVTENNTQDAQAYRIDQANVRVVIDFMALPAVETVGALGAINWDVKLPKAGLPCNEGDGFQTFIWNPDGGSAFSNGPVVLATSRIQGVWL